jgi:hypothetical protein
MPDTRPVDVRLLMGGRLTAVLSVVVPAVGDNLAKLGFPEWYVFQLKEWQGRIVFDCRLETARASLDRDE